MTEVLKRRDRGAAAGVRAGVRAATRDIADEVTTPFRVWSASIYLCALQVRLLDYRVIALQLRYDCDREET